MQTMSLEMPWCRVLRVLALGLTIVLGVEWTAPLGSAAQPNGGPAPASPSITSAATQELPPIQEAEVIEVRKPFYKTWWFWTLVGVVAIGAGAAAMSGGGGGGSSAPVAGPSGTVTVNGPAPR